MAASLFLDVLTKVVEESTIDAPCIEYDALKKKDANGMHYFT